MTRIQALAEGAPVGSTRMTGTLPVRINGMDCDAPWEVLATPGFCYHFEPQTKGMPALDSIYAAWRAIGADVAGLEWSKFAALLTGTQAPAPAHEPADHQSIATALREQGERERTYELQDAFNRAAQIVERMGK